MADYVILAVEDRIATITLNRPEVGNALNRILLAELRDCVQRVSADQSIDVVIITGAGRMFCSGEDLRGLASQEGTLEQVTLTCEVFDMITEIPQPTIAAVNGYAVTGGIEMILGCDIRIASENAMFADTHARVALMPGGGDSQMLPRLIGLARAKEMIFTSDFVSAQEAAQIGLVNRVVPADRLLDEARAIAKKIQANNQWIVRRVKATMNQGWGMDLKAAMIFERQECLRFMISGKAQELADEREGMKDRNRASITARPR